MGASLQVTVGRLLCRQVRDYLKQCEFKNENIKWIESSGFIERTFVIKGDQPVLEDIESDLDRWIKKREAKP